VVSSFEPFSFGRKALTASVALRAPSAVKVAGHKKQSVNGVMALFGVNDVMALEN
jgi:hypothetical protein